MCCRVLRSKVHGYVGHRLPRNWLCESSGREKVREGGRRGREEREGGRKEEREGGKERGREGEREGDLKLAVILV